MNVHKCRAYIYTYVRLYIYVNTHVRTYVRTHARTHARTHTHTHTHILCSPDAQCVLLRDDLSLDGAELTVTHVMVQETTPKRTRKPEPSCASTNTSSVQILQISGFKPTAGRDTVKMFIENKTRGTELQSFDYDVSTGVAIVELSNSQGTTLY